MARDEIEPSLYTRLGGYDAIAEQLFNDLAVDRILAEYDSPRAGTFEPLRFVPPDKTVVLGLITTKEPELEEIYLSAVKSAGLEETRTIE